MMRLRSSITTWLAATTTAALLVTAAGAQLPGRTPRPRRTSGDNLAKSLEARLKLSDTRVTMRDSLDMELTVRNTSNRDLTLPFNTAQRYEFEVMRGNNVVWKWSGNKDWPRRPETVALKAGEALTYHETWKIRNMRRVENFGPGEYTVRAYLTPEGAAREIGDKRDITIQR